MKIPSTLPQFTHDPALIAVVGQQHGVLYLAKDGIIERVASVDEPVATYSDREGFFMRMGGGNLYGTGGPYDGDAVQDRNRFIADVTDELRDAAITHDVVTIYIFEPEHLKGELTAELRPKVSADVVAVDYGNFVHEHPKEILKRVGEFVMPSKDPSDPDSVKGEANAKEKRKLLEVGRTNQ